MPPLTAQEKNTIVQGSTSAAGLTIGAQAGLGSLGTAGLGLVFLPLILGLQQQFNRVSFPKLPGFGEILDPVFALRARGLDPRISSSPFTGNVVISTADQARFLPGLIRGVEERRAAEEIDFSPLFGLREQVIEGLAETAVERGFLAEIPPDLRGGVFRETAESPLQFIQTGGTPL